FRYMLYPFDGSFAPVEALHEVAQMQTDPFVHTTACEPRTTSFLSIKPGKAVLSTLKPAEEGDGIIVRLWNPTDAPLVETLRFTGAVQSAWTCGLNEAPGDEIVRDSDGGIPITAPPRGLASARLHVR